MKLSEIQDLVAKHLRIDVQNDAERLPLANQLRRHAFKRVSDHKHSDKFHFQKVCAGLLASAASTKTFSGTKVDDLIKKLKKLAINLYLEPWRSEDFSELPLWSAFYSYELANNLPDYQALLGLIGFEKKQNEHKESVMALIHVGNPNQLVDVITDCLLMSAELQIIQQIHDKLSETHEIDWMQIWKCRCDHKGDADDCCRQLMKTIPKKSVQFFLARDQSETALQQHHQNGSIPEPKPQASGGGLASNYLSNAPSSTTGGSGWSPMHLSSTQTRVASNSDYSLRTKSHFH